MTGKISEDPDKVVDGTEKVAAVFEGTNYGILVSSIAEHILSSPDLTGVPTAPTASPSDNSDQIATTAYVDAQVVGGVSGVASLNGATGAINFTVARQVFTASGTYTPTSGMKYAILECVGSGGGGGSAAGTAGDLFSGGGGGAGSYSRVVVSAATVGASKTVTVGNAGAGGASGSNNGTAGSDVSVGTLCVGKGGSGGLYGSVSQGPAGGAGGVAGTGDITIPGGPGSNGFYATVATVVSNFNNGGNSVLGYGAIAPLPVNAAAVAGNSGTNYGAGGSGAVALNTASTAAGGNASKGVVFITEFCVA